MEPQRSSEVGWRYSKLPQMQPFGRRPGMPGNFKVRRISADTVSRVGDEVSFVAPGSVSPDSEAGLPYFSLEDARGRNAVRASSSIRQGSNNGSRSESSAPRQQSPMSWSENGDDGLSDSSDAGSRCSIDQNFLERRASLVDAIEEDRLSLPSSDGSRPASYVSCQSSHADDNSIPTPTIESAATFEELPQIFSFESAKAVKIIRVCMPAFVAIDESNIRSTPGTPGTPSTPNTRSARTSINFSRPLTSSYASPSVATSHHTTHASKSSIFSAASSISSYHWDQQAQPTRCSSRSSMKSDMSGMIPPVTLPVVTEDGTTGTLGTVAPKKRWTWMNKAKTKSRYFVRSFAEGRTPG